MKEPEEVKVFRLAITAEDIKRPERPFVENFMNGCTIFNEKPQRF
jgi:hypothetical protein